MKKKRDRKHAALHARETSRLLAHLVVLSPGGVMPDPLELVRSHRELVEALVMRLGGLEEARDKAGLRVAGGRPRWTQERVVVELRAHAAAGRVLLTQLPRSLQSAIYTRFGSLPKAREAAGMVRAWTRDQVLEELHANAAKGRRTTATLPKALRAAMVAQFGSVDAARTAAGIEVQVRRRWTRERVVEELRAHAAEGRTSTKQLPPMLCGDALAVRRSSRCARGRRDRGSANSSRMDSRSGGRGAASACREWSDHDLAATRHAV